MKRCLRFLACFLLAALALSSLAQKFPSRPVVLVVPYPPGGTADRLARSLTERMSRELGQTVIVENVGGAGGAVGIDKALRAPPDGYALLMLSGGAIHGYTSKVVDDFRNQSFVASIGRAPLFLVVRADGPYKDLQALLNSKKGVSIATAGPGSLSEYNAMTLAAEIRARGGQGTPIPYRGSSPAAQDLLGGSVDAAFLPAVGVDNFIRDGKLRVVGITGKTRLPARADVPTIAEIGAKSTYIDDWFAVVGPRGIPADVLKALASAISSARTAVGDRAFNELGVAEERQDERGYRATVTESVVHAVGGGGGTTCGEGRCYCSAKNACQDKPCTSGC